MATRRLFSREFKLEAVKLVVERGVSVAHGDIDSDLDVYADGRFDYVILNESLQQVLDIEKILDAGIGYAGLRKYFIQ